jgi:hypothetical protein
MKNKIWLEIRSVERGTGQRYDVAFDSHLGCSPWGSEEKKDRTKSLKVIAISIIQYGRHPAAVILDIWNLKVSGNSFCGSEFDHQISKGSFKRFKSCLIFKNPRWPPAYGCHLDFFIKKIWVITLVDLKLFNTFQIDRLSGLDVIAISKIQN